MDLLERLLGHDYWTTKQLLLRCQELTDEQLDRPFDLGHRTVRATLAHIVRNMEVWSALMAERPIGANHGRSVSELIGRLDCAAGDLEKVARSVAQRNAWDEEFVDTLDNPPVRKTYGGGIAHIITHSMHHRAQLIHMLRKLGVQGVLEGDVLSWEQESGNLKK